MPTIVPNISDTRTAVKVACILSLWMGVSTVVPHVFAEQGTASRITIALHLLFAVLTLGIIYRLVIRCLRASRLADEAKLQVESHIAELDDSRAARKEAIEKFAIITGSIPSLIAHMDVDQRYLYVNARYAAWIGRSEDEIVGRTALEILGDKIYADTVGCIEQVLQGKFSSMERHAGMMGENRIQHMLFIPRLDQHGAVSSYFALINDITEIRQAEEQLRHAHKMEAIGTLAGGIAHDFNNLLTIIMGCAEMINTGHGAHDNNRQMVSLIIEAANRGAGLTRNLLAFSRNQEMEVKSFDLNGQVRKLENLLCRIIGEDIVIKLRLCDGPLNVMADAEQYDQVVMNMVSNARDAMPNGGTLTISTSLEERKLPSSDGNDDAPAVKCAVLEIADTGSGMSRYTLERIFDPFFTTKEVGKGTGLGLSMAYGIIEKHNGFIEVDSTPGEGTFFRIFLPSVEMAAESSAHEFLPVLFKGEGTILLVEDDPILQRIMTTLLEKYGYRVLVAANGVEGITMYLNSPEPIHLILSDVIMPVKTGIQMVKEIHLTCPNVPVIFISGYEAGYVESFAALTDVVHFIPKPLQLSLLLAKIRQIMEGPPSLAVNHRVKEPFQGKPDFV